MKDPLESEPLGPVPGLQEFAAIVIEHLPDPVYLVRDDSRIVYANAAAVELMGYSRDEFLGMRVTDLNVDMPAARWTVVWEYLRKAGTNTQQSMHRAKNGQVIPIEVSATLVTIGEVEYSVAHARDMTTRRALEERLRHTEKMEALGQLAGGVAHDFNNQLVGVVSYAEILEDELQDSPHLLEHVEQILACGVRCADLTRQLLAFSRRNPPMMTAIDVHTVLDEALQVLDRTLPRRVTLRRDLRARRHHVRGDASLLSSCFLNLALNARDAMGEEGGTLVVETRQVELDARDCRDRAFRVIPGSYLRVAVRDDGQGIAPEALARVFEPFYTTKPSGEGTGLGLAMVYGTVTAHLGEVSVESEPGRGTVFHVYLPLAPEENEPRVAPRERSEEAAHVLLVEDEDHVRRVALLLLQRLGYRVTAFAGAVEALEFFRDAGETIDLVLLDMCMPIMDGSRLFREMQALQPEVKVLLASGYAVGAEVEVLIASGAKGFIQKPFRRAALAEALSAVLSGQSAPTTT